MNPQDLSGAVWFTSSYSSDSGNACVEIADLHTAVGVRDSKDRARAAVTVSRPAWAAFVRGLGEG